MPTTGPTETRHASETPRRVDRRRALGWALVVVSALGVIGSVVGIVIGWRLLGTLDDALGASLELVDTSLRTVDATVTLTEEAVELAGEGLARAEDTSAVVSASIDDTHELLGRVADLTGEDVAEAVDAVEGALPALVQASAATDRTLRALAVFGLAYEPERPLDESVGDIQRSLDGMSDDLREQATLVRGAAEQLGAVGDHADDLTGDLAALRSSLAGVQALLGEYSATAGEASALMSDTRADLGRDLALARAVVVLLGLAVALGQAAPLAVGLALLDRPLRP